MKKKSIKLILSLVFLSILVGGYFCLKTYVAKREEAEEEKEKEEKTISVAEINDSDLKSLGFIIDKKEVVFEKEDDLWVKQDEKDFPVDQDTIAGAVSSLESISADRVLEKVDDLEEYGLDSPQNTITVKEADKETVLRIGSLNESTSQYYVNKDDDRNTVYVVSESSVSPFMKSLYDYAQAQEFPYIDASSINKVSLQNKNDSYEIVKDSDALIWNVCVEDTSEKADSAKCSELTSSVSALAYDKFIDYHSSDDSQYGLDVPYAKVTIDYIEELESETEENDTESAEDEGSEDKDTDSESETNEEETVETVEKSLTLYVGDTAEDDTRYVKVDGSDEIYTMSQETLSAVIDQKYTDYLDLTVYILAVNNLDTLTIDRDGELHTVNVSRETSKDEDGEEKTTLSYQLDGTDIESVRFTTFYNKVIGMTAQERYVEEFSPGNQAELIISFKDVDGNETVVSYYEYDTNFYAAVRDEKVYLINKMSVRDLLSGYEEFLETDTSEN